MSYRPLAAGAFALLTASCCASAALAHAVCGPRIFPATLGIDDPGVNDEAALPTIAYVPHNGDGMEEFDASFSYSKTIFPNFALAVGDGVTWLRGQGFGRDDLETEEKLQLFCIPEAEFMASAGFAQDWGKTYTNGMGNDFNTYTPLLDVGLGFGSLPKSLNLLRPFAITGEVSYDIPDHSFVEGNQLSRNLNWGFTIQYSLPYFNANVAEIDNPVLKRLVPLTEFAFSTPVSNFAPGTNITTGYVQPGVMYVADSYQVSLEAILPMNSASGHGVGVIGELHFFLDDIFPNTLGKPIFGSSR